MFSRDVTFDESAMLKKVTKDQEKTVSISQQVEPSRQQVEFEKMITVVPVNVVENSSDTLLAEGDTEDKE